MICGLFRVLTKMDFVTTGSLRRVATGKIREDPPRVILAQRRSLDLLAMSALLLSTPELDLVGAELSLQQLVESSRTLRPEVVVIDTRYPEGTAFDAASDLLENKYARHVLFLDEAASSCHAERAAGMQNTGYLTKEASLENLCEAIEQLNAVFRRHRRSKIFSLPSPCDHE